MSIRMHRRCTRYWFLALLSLGAQANAQDDVDCIKCVDPVDIAPAAVTAGKIKNQAVTTAKLAGAAVTTQKIKKQAVTTAKIADGAVTGSKIAGSVIGAGKVKASQIQLRVGGACGVGSFVSKVNQDGSVTCESGAFVFYNTKYGEEALDSSTTGWYNTANGHNALLNTTSGNSNTLEQVTCPVAVAKGVTSAKRRPNVAASA